MLKVLWTLNPSTSQFEEQLFIWWLIHILSHWHEDITTNELVNDFDVRTCTCKCDGFSFTLNYHFSCLPVYIPIFHDTVAPCLCWFTTCCINSHDSVECYSKNFLKHKIQQQKITTYTTTSSQSLLAMDITG